MKALIIFDSLYGNTEKIANSIGESISGEGSVIVPVGDANPRDLKNFDLIIMGSPTHGGRPSNDIKEYLGKIPNEGLSGKSFAAFDTRIEAENRGMGIRMLTKVLGYAAGRIGKSLEKKKGQQVIEPEGFFVKDREGPLKDGELERAKEWGKDILEKIGQQR